MAAATLNQRQQIQGFKVVGLDVNYRFAKRTRTLEHSCPVEPYGAFACVGRGHRENESQRPFDCARQARPDPTSVDPQQNNNAADEMRTTLGARSGRDGREPSVITGPRGG